MKSNSLNGFTMVELMVVLAVVSILAAVALPAYLNYSTRAKVTEGVGMMSAAKTDVMSFYVSNSTFPVTNLEAGLGPSTDYASRTVTGVSIGGDPSAGTITVELNLPQLGTDNLLQLVPTASESGFDWTCQAASVNGIVTNFLPSSCR